MERIHTLHMLAKKHRRNYASIRKKHCETKDNTSDKEEHCTIKGSHHSLKPVSKTETASKYIK